MNRVEHLIVIVAEEASEIAKEASLLIEWLCNDQARNGVMLDLGAAFDPLLNEYADLIGAFNKLTGKTADPTRTSLRWNKAEKDFGQIGDATGNETAVLLRLLAQISSDALDIAVRASKAARFGMEEVQPGQAIPYSNHIRLMSAFADLVGILGYMSKRYVLDYDNAAWQARIWAKSEKIEKFLDYSAKCGTLLEPVERSA